jgi:hypothetical protein
MKLKTEAEQVGDGADKAGMLMRAVMQDINKGRDAGFAEANPLLVTACMNAAIGWHIVEALRALDLGGLASFEKPGD